MRRQRSNVRHDPSLHPLVRNGETAFLGVLTDLSMKYSLWVCFDQTMSKGTHEPLDCSGLRCFGSVDFSLVILCRVVSFLSLQ